MPTPRINLIKILIVLAMTFPSFLFGGNALLPLDGSDINTYIIDTPKPNQTPSAASWGTHESFKARFIKVTTLDMISVKGALNIPKGKSLATKNVRLEITDFGQPVLMVRVPGTNLGVPVWGAMQEMYKDNKRRYLSLYPVSYEHFRVYHKRYRYMQAFHVKNKNLQDVVVNAIDCKANLISIANGTIKFKSLERYTRVDMAFQDTYAMSLNEYLGRLLILGSAVILFGITAKFVAPILLLEAKAALVDMAVEVSLNEVIDLAVEAVTDNIIMSFKDAINELQTNIGVEAINQVNMLQQAMKQSIADVREAVEDLKQDEVFMAIVQTTDGKTRDPKIILEYLQEYILQELTDSADKYAKEVLGEDYKEAMEQFNQTVTGIRKMTTDQIQKGVFELAVGEDNVKVVEEVNQAVTEIRNMTTDQVQKGVFELVVGEEDAKTAYKIVEVAAKLRKCRNKMDMLKVIYDAVSASFDIIGDDVIKQVTDAVSTAGNISDTLKTIRWSMVNLKDPLKGVGILDTVANIALVGLTASGKDLGFTPPYNVSHFKAPALWPNFYDLYRAGVADITSKDYMTLEITEGGNLKIHNADTNKEWSTRTEGTTGFIDQQVGTFDSGRTLTNNLPFKAVVFNMENQRLFSRKGTRNRLSTSHASFGYDFKARPEIVFITEDKKAIVLSINRIATDYGRTQSYDQNDNIYLETKLGKDGFISFHKLLNVNDFGHKSTTYLEGETLQRIYPHNNSYQAPFTFAMTSFYVAVLDAKGMLAYFWPFPGNGLEDGVNL